MGGGRGEGCILPRCDFFFFSPQFLLLYLSSEDGKKKSPRAEKMRDDRKCGKLQCRINNKKKKTGWGGTVANGKKLSKREGVN